MRLFTNRLKKEKLLKHPLRSWNLLSEEHHMDSDRMESICMLAENG